MDIHGIPLAELRDLAEITVAVAVATDTGVFEALGDAPASPTEVASRTGLDERAVGILLAMLAEEGLLVREDEERYRPTEECRRELCRPDGADFVGGGLPHWLESLRDWTRLGRVLRTGEPLSSGEERDEEDIERFMAAMAAAPDQRVRRIVRACLDRHPDARTVLDLGGGPGHMARAFVEEGLEATLLDTPETVDVVEREYGLDGVEGLTLERGDFLEDPLPSGPFDIVLLSNILHIYGPEQNRAVLRKVGEVTAPGGVAAVGEFVRGESGRAARFAVLMLMKTESGDTYTKEELTEWLQAAGFQEVRVEDVDEDRQLVTAVRR